MKLKDYWPRCLQDLVEFQQIANAEQPEFETALDDVRTAADDFFLATLSEYGCQRWEAIMGLHAADGDTLEARRERILIKYLDQLPYTYRTLLKYLKTITDDFTVTLDENAYDLFIRIRLEGYSQRDALIATLGQMIPANLVLRLKADIPQTDEPAQTAACSAMVTMNRHVYTPATYEDIVRQVFLLSNTNVGLSNENGVAEGSLWSYFNSASRRQCYPTAEAVSKSTYTSSSLSASQYWWWWLRTPYAGNAYNARIVGTDGSLRNCYAYDGSYGVRPALYLASSNLVSDTTDTDGAYILLWNQPPTTPTSITYGTPQAGQKLTLSTGGSTDPEGDAISYVWERKVDSGVWTQIGITTAKTIQDTVPSSGTTYYARVKAVDAVGNESAYCTGSGKAISYNTPPVISGSDQNLGAKTDPFTYQYSVTDAQSATQTLTVTETLTNGTETITLRTYTATAGAQNTADLSSVWIRLIAGTHVLKITASDGNGGTAVRNITFSRTVTRIAAARAFNTDAKVTKVFVSLYPSDRPAGSTLHLEVTNNPFDTSPVWEDITEKANRLVHTFANSTVANGYGLGYRFYLLKGTEEIEITQATIRFA